AICRLVVSDQPEPEEEPVKPLKFPAMMACGAAGLCLALCSCASLQGADAPEPGTKAYYDQNIKDRFALINGRMAPMRTPASDLDMVRAGRGMAAYLGSASPVSTDWIDGHIAQIVNSTALVVRVQAHRNTGVTKTVPCLVMVGNTSGLATNQPFRCRVLAYPSTFVCDTSTGETNKSVGVWTELRSISFEEYQQAYQADASAAEPFTGNIVGYRRLTRSFPMLPGMSPSNSLPRRRPGGVPGPVPGIARPMPLPAPPPSAVAPPPAPTVLPPGPK
ncbi:MAG: hypothetical protein KJ579_01825, partial [Verrucomicrobia bacterium]|nr:hypothetical protein [Verrucomicrobiota bacterium]